MDGDWGIQVKYLRVAGYRRGMQRAGIYLRLRSVFRFLSISPDVNVNQYQKASHDSKNDERGFMCQKNQNKRLND
jgi:hypothetical protein